MPKGIRFLLLVLSAFLCYSYAEKVCLQYVTYFYILHLISLHILKYHYKKVNYK